MNKDKFRLLLIFTITIILLVTASLFGFIMLGKQEINLGNTIVLAIPLIIIIFMAFFALRRYEDVKEGMPLEDERSKKVINQAAAKSFYISIYWLLFISWFENLWVKIFDLENLTVGQAIGAGIGGMALIFFACWFYYDKKGKLI